MKRESSTERSSTTSAMQLSAEHVPTTSRLITEKYPSGIRDTKRLSMVTCFVWVMTLTSLSFHIVCSGSWNRECSTPLSVWKSLEIRQCRLSRAITQHLLLSVSILRERSIVRLLPLCLLTGITKTNTDTITFVY